MVEGFVKKEVTVAWSQNGV